MATTPVSKKPSLAPPSFVICNLCLEFLDDCPPTPHTKGRLIDEGAYLPDSPGGPEEPPKVVFDVIIQPCRCQFHHHCVVKYIRSKLQDKSSLVIGKQRRGLACPNCAISNNSLRQGNEITEAEVLKIHRLGLLKQAPDRLLQEEIEKLKRFCTEETSVALVKDGSLDDPLLSATTKPCPTCGFRASHPHGHGCHHISPYGGCRNCKTHFCYQCRSSQHQNELLRGNPAKCECGYWSAFCKPMKTLNDILSNIQLTPYPHDRRCGCVICSDCRLGKPCAECPQVDCGVCRGLIPHGPLSLDDIPRFKQELDLIASRHEVNSLFLELVEACRECNWNYFHSLDPNIVLPTSAKDELGNTLLHYAAINAKLNSHRILKFFLTKLPYDVLETNNEGRTPLQLAMIALATLINLTKTRSYQNLQESVIAQQELVIEMLQMAPYDDVCRMMVEKDVTVVDWALKDERRLVCLVCAFPGGQWVNHTNGYTLLYRLLETEQWQLCHKYLDMINGDNEDTLMVNYSCFGRPLLSLIAEALQKKHTTPKSELRDRLVAIAKRQWHVVDQNDRYALHAIVHYLMEQTSSLQGENYLSDKTHLITGLVNLTISLTQGILTLSHSNKSTYLLHKDNDGNTILHYCSKCIQLYPEPFTQLINIYPNLINIKNNNNDLPLHYLANEWHSPMCWKLLMELEDIILPLHDMNIKDRISPFLILCKLEEPRTRSRSIISLDSDSGMTPVNSLLCDIIHYMFTNYCKSDGFTIQQHRNKLNNELRRTNSNYQTALHLLILSGHYEALIYLIHHSQAFGISLPYATKDNEGNNCLHLLCNHSELDKSLIEMIIEKCLPTNSNAPVTNGGKSGLYKMILSKNKKNHTVLDILGMKWISLNKDKIAIELLDKFIQFLYSENNQIPLNDILFTNRIDGIESIVNMLCRSPCKHAHNLLLEWLENGIITTPTSLSHNSLNLDGCQALQLLINNVSARKRDNFQTFIARILGLWLNDRNATLLLSNACDDNNNTILHHIALQRDLFILRILLDKHYIIPELCLIKNKDNATFIHLLLTNVSRVRRGGPPIVKERNRERTESQVSNASIVSNASSTMSHESEISETFDEYMIMRDVDGEEGETSPIDGAYYFGKDSGMEDTMAGVSYDDIHDEEDDEPIILEIFELIRETTIMSELLEIRNQHQESILQLALGCHYVNIAQLLFDAWLDHIPAYHHKMFCKDLSIGGFSLIEWCCIFPHFYPLFERLTTAGSLSFTVDDIFHCADLPIFEGLDPEDDFRDNQPLLHWLCCHRDVPHYTMISMMLSIPLSSQFVVDVIDEHTGRNACHIACEKDDIVLLKLLLGHPQTSLEQKHMMLFQADDKGETPSDVARYSGVNKVFEYLLETPGLGVSGEEYDDEVQPMDS